MLMIIKNATPHHIKNGIKIALSSHAGKLVNSIYAGLGTCLCYHSVVPTDRTSTPWYKTYLCVTEKDFESQIKFISKNYNCIDLPTAIEKLKNKKLPKKSVIVTFDDGYRNNLSVAFPILKKYNVPATIYITTGLIDRRAHFWWDEQGFIINNHSHLSFDWEGRHFNWTLISIQEKMSAYKNLTALFKTLNLDKQKELMKLIRLRSNLHYNYNNEILSWKEVKHLDSDPLITIGAHTINHPILSNISTYQAKEEIAHSKKIIEKQLKHSIDHFSYPFGEEIHVSSREFDLAETAGFSSSFTTNIGHLFPEHIKHLHSLPRMGISFDDSLLDFKLKMNGAFAMLINNGKKIMPD